MKSNFTALITLALLACLLAVLIPIVAADTSEQSTGSLTRGSRFTVTITGLPNTPYYVWLTRTFTMSGEPYDQPPVISGGTENLIKDPEGGPYTIGSYQFNNGNGRTILDDVAPTSTAMSNTNYYAQVTTDSTGKALVQFRTSAYTAIRSYSVKTENPAKPESGNFNVEENVYSRGSKPMINTPAETIATYPASPSLTPTPTPSPEAVTTTIPIPATTPTPTPTTRSPLDPGIAIVAVMAGLAAVLRQ